MVRARGGEGSDDPAGLVFGQYGGQAFGFLGAQGVDGAVEFLVQHLSIEEQDGTVGLILGGRGHVSVHGQVGEEGCDLGVAHLIGVALVVKEDKAADPVHVGLFGADGIVFEADGVADLVEEFPGFLGHEQPPRVDLDAVQISRMMALYSKIPYNAT
ncbi:MAG: hypothetical protein KKB13_17455 [Chloroflexi bacterium]|nr:hypothetical protein [Chloroflexota bacterium]